MPSLKIKIPPIGEMETVPEEPTPEIDISHEDEEDKQDEVDVKEKLRNTIQVG